MGIKEQQRINMALKLVSPRYKLVEGVINFNVGNKPTHELGKFLKCWELKSEGKKFYTEVIFKDGLGRCDIFVPADFRVFEILDSETQERFEEKLSKYPKELEIIPIRAKDIIKEAFENGQIQME